MVEPLTLRDEHWNVVVAPSHGGSLEFCLFDGIPVLQPTALLERAGASALFCCYFPMIPYCNRIENSSFDFAGATVKLRENVTGTRHAIHGHGWQTSWGVTHASPTKCALSYRHEATAEWPWLYEGKQSFEILGSALHIALEVQNLCSKPMPCGLGFHPFFPTTAGVRLQLAANRVWNGNVRDFPREPIPVPKQLCFAAGAPIADRMGTDHCFDDWQRRAVVTFAHSNHDIVIDACAATGFVLIYIPGGDHFCVEPVTHAVNAMNFADPAAAGLWTLAPAESRRITTSLRVEFRQAGGTRFAAATPAYQ